ncbi:DUF4300 family protein [Anaerococcus urinomassiliensis]|uniref:DUF4300 family protein n=1 Tax=Anaerococcus urinomassiliensis TaxID=1745712 RepID=UPI00093AF987|nr:DUF4300 family protein [Anaerococcus urinomassiliensis]
MKKILILILSILCLSSCSENKEMPKNDGSKLVYNNLLTKKSRDDLKSIIKMSDLDHKKTDRFFKQVEFFNSRVKSDLLVKEDYVRADKVKDYDVYAIQDQLYKLDPNFTGINCRITTFGLVSDKIEVKNKANPNMSVVEIDNTSFNNPPVDTLDKDEIEKFNKFYSAIPTENKNDVNYQVNKIVNFWKESGIKFHKNDIYEVISVFEFSNIDENKNELFVGHTGLLFKLNDGRLMLVEKLAFTAPYQVVIFDDENNLYDYLMDLYDYSNDDYPIKPIIFRDEKVFVKN